MDYMDLDQIEFYQSSEKFFEKKQNQRIVLMTTKGSISYTEFKFKSDDTILFGRESAGVPEKVHKLIKDRLKIPMNEKVRSLNIASSVLVFLFQEVDLNLNLFFSSFTMSSQIAFCNSLNQLLVRSFLISMSI